MYTLPKRKNNSYKKDYGVVLILAGNHRYGGAGIMAASAALHSGAGLITLATHPNNIQSLHALYPEIMSSHWKTDLEERVQESNVLLIGPGLGTDDCGRSVIENAFKHSREDQILVLDASALYVLSKEKRPKGTLILTPHLGEFKVMSGLSSKEINDQSCLHYAKELDAYLILKGHQSKLYHNGKVYENIPGTPAMATGGTGDVLAGMLAGFLAQFEPLFATRAALYLHSKIAVELAKDNYVVLPTEIIKRIPIEMKKMEE